MKTSSRTPKGHLGRWPVCGKRLKIKKVTPTTLFGDAPCTFCGSLLFFVSLSPGAQYYEHEAAAPVRERMKRLLASILRVSPDKIRNELNDLSFKELGGDSLDTIELIIELENELGIGFHEEDDDENDNGAAKGEWPPMAFA